MTRRWQRLCLPLFTAALLLGSCASSKGRLFAMVDTAVEGIRAQKRAGHSIAPRQTESLWVDAQHHVLKASHTADPKIRSRYLESARKCVNMLRWDHPHSESVRRLDARIAALETQHMLQANRLLNSTKLEK